MHTYAVDVNPKRYLRIMKPIRRLCGIKEAQVERVGQACLYIAGIP